MIVDATFSTSEQRSLFKELATKKQVRFIILEFTASNETLKKRIQQRENDVSDADLNVLENQIRSWHPLTENERNYSLLINTENNPDISQILNQLKLD